MVTGKVPFHGKDMVATLMAVSVSDPPRPDRINPQVSRALSKLIMRLLEKCPQARFPSTKAVAAALRTIEPNATPRSSKPQRRRLFAASLATVAGSLMAFYLRLQPASSGVSEPNSSEHLPPASPPQAVNATPTHLAQLPTSPDYEWSAPRTLDRGSTPAFPNTSAA